MKDVRLQSSNFIEPTSHQMMCGLKVNKMKKCVVLPQPLFTRCLFFCFFDGAQNINTHCKSRQEFLCVGEGWSGSREGRGKGEAPPQGSGEVVIFCFVLFCDAWTPGSVCDDRHAPESHPAEEKKKKCPYA